MVEGEAREIYAGFGIGDRRLFVVVWWIEEFDFPAVRIISVRDFEKRDKYKFDDMNEDADTIEPPIDPDNPPMTGNEVWVPAREHFLKKYAEIKARITAREQAEQARNDAAE